jgi:DNA-binding FadR family transcriptional regulator
MEKPFTPIVTETAPTQIAKRIKAAILSGVLKVEERLPTETELAETFAVSRHTIREALKRLAAENLVESRRGAVGGSFIKVPTWQDIKSSIATSLTVAASLNQLTFEQVIDCRFEMISMCCRLAATHRDADDLRSMGAEVAAQRNVEFNDVEFCASDVRFHCAIAAATKNPIISSHTAGVLEGLEPITNLLLFRFRERDVIADQHEEMTKCIEAYNADGAIAALAHQVAYLKEKHLDAQRYRSDRDNRKQQA